MIPTFLSFAAAGAGLVVGAFVAVCLIVAAIWFIERIAGRLS